MRAQIAAVRAAKPAKLYMAVDGPRDGRPDEAKKCAAVRECAKLVDWPCEVKTLFREKNLGCKYAPSQAIDWFFSNEEKGIILEDDCHPTPDFFRFISEMLVRFRNVEQIGLVSGYNLFGLQSDKATSYHFSRIAMMSGGWGTWQRVWKLYDVDMKPYLPHVNEIMRKLPCTSYFRSMFMKSLKRVQNGMDAWDFQFTLMMFATGKLGIVPQTQLVINVGFDSQAATHTGGYNYYADRFTSHGKISFPLVHPSKVVCDEWADRTRERMEGAIFPRGLTWLGSKIPALCPLLTWCGKITEKYAPFLFRL